MTLASILRTLLHVGQEPASDQLADTMDSEWSITSAHGIQELISCFIRDKTRLHAHRVDGTPAGSVQLLACRSGAIHFQMQHADGIRDPVQLLHLNVWCQHERGIAMLTLHAQKLDTADLWQADMPTVIIRMQSRQHRRIRCIHGPIHKASVILPAPFQSAELYDLSEGGMGLQCAMQQMQVFPSITSGVLLLDGDAITLPSLTTVHCTRTAACSWRIGVKFNGLNEESLRRMRRWLDLTESCQSIRQQDVPQAAADTPTSSDTLSNL